MGKIAKSYKFTEETVETLNNKLEALNESKRANDEDEITVTSFLELVINEFNVKKFIDPEGDETDDNEVENKPEDLISIKLEELESKINAISEVLEKVNFEVIDSKINSISEILEKVNFTDLSEKLKNVSRDITLNTDWIKIDLATHIDLHKVEKDPELRKRLVYDIKDYPRLKNIIARDVNKLKEEEKNHDDKAGNAEK